jgi:trehalose 6-phosphate phosphatase
MRCSEANVDHMHPVLAPPPLADPATMALFLDIDGTLIDFADRPDGVIVDIALPPLLHALHHRLDGALAPLSGRPLHEIDALLGLPPAAAAGVHGAELRDASGRMLVTTHDSARMAALRERARTLLASHSGVQVEAKPDALSLHYRNAPEAAASVRAVARILLREAGADYALQPGDQVMELKPAGVDKGAAIAALMRSPPFSNRTPWVLGDDLTDEHAFALVNAHNGISVIVGVRRPTAARYALADPRAVRTWLAMLMETNVDTGQRPP